MKTVPLVEDRLLFPVRWAATSHTLAVACGQNYVHVRGVDTNLNSVPLSSNDVVFQVPVDPVGVCRIQ